MTLTIDQISQDIVHLEWYLSHSAAGLTAEVEVADLRSVPDDGLRSFVRFGVGDGRRWRLWYEVRYIGTVHRRPLIETPVQVRRVAMEVLPTLLDMIGEKAKETA